MKTYPHPFKQVEDFMTSFEQYPPSEYGEKRELYRKLIIEEFSEFLNAEFDDDSVEICDGVCDLIWVLVGYAKSRGWGIEGAFDEVARSNMSKLDPETGKPIKREDGKIMKGSAFFKPELSKYLG